MKALLEEVFSVKVIAVNSFVLPGKRGSLGRFKGFKPGYKRIIVTLLCLFLLI